MKLLNRKQFLETEKVVFSFYSEKSFLDWSGLYVKYQTLGNDFCFTDIFNQIGFEFSNSWDENGYIANKKLENGEEISIDTECGERDGFFDDKQRFIVYSKEDVEKMIKALQKTIN